MKPVYLYVKQHSKTGLMYFGKTIRSDVETYLGSGIYWTNHIKKHGSGDVKTVWVSEAFTDVSELTDFAQLFSEHFDIVNSSLWGNLVIENGITGGAIRTGAVLSEETREKLRIKATGRKASSQTKQKMSEAHKGHIQTDKQKHAMRDYNLSRNLPKLVCPHCAKIGSYVAMHRWHFDKCKIKEN